MSCGSAAREVFSSSAPGHCHHLGLSSLSPDFTSLSSRAVDSALSVGTTTRSAMRRTHGACVVQSSYLGRLYPASKCSRQWEPFGLLCKE